MQRPFIGKIDLLSVPTPSLSGIKTVKTVAEAIGKHRSCKIGILKGVNNEDLVDDYEKAERLSSFLTNVGKELAENYLALIISIKIFTESSLQLITCP